MAAPTLAYFGVFLVAPLTAALVVLLAGVLTVGAVVVASGLDGRGEPWRLVAVPLALLAVGGVRALEGLRRRWWPPRIVSLVEAGRPEMTPLTGAKATGLGRVLAAGLPTPPGVVLTTAAAAGIERLARGAPSWRDRIFAARLQRILDALPDGHVVVRSSFAWEDRESGSAAGIFHTEHDVGRTVEAVCRAARLVFRSATRPEAAPFLDGHAGRGLAVLVQAQAELEALGVVSSVDPRTGFVERAIVQRTTLIGPEAGATVVQTFDRLRGQQHPAVALCDRLARDASGPIEIEVGWTLTGGLVVLQQRPLNAVPEAPTWVSGGPVAVPAVPLAEAWRARYVGPDGLAARLRRTLEPIGLPGPADEDVLERDGRFYLRWRGEVRPTAELRFARAAIGLGPRTGDPVIAGARAMLMANAWWQVAERLAGALPAGIRRALEAGVQPEGRPEIPEDLDDPGYDAEWPRWEVPAPPRVELPPMPPLRRLAVRISLWAYRRWLVARFEHRERVLADNRAARDAHRATAGAPPDLAHRVAPPAAMIWHPTAPGAGDFGAWGPAVTGTARGPLALGDPGDRTGVILAVTDASAQHARHFDRVAGLVVDRAGPLSHLVLLARERGIPTVLGAPPDWPEGTEVILDGDLGTLSR